MGGAGLLVMLTASVLLLTGLNVSVGSRDLLTILTSSLVSFATNLLISPVFGRSVKAEDGGDGELGTRVQEPASPLGMILPRAKPRGRGMHSPHSDA